MVGVNDGRDDSTVTVVILEDDRYERIGLQVELQDNPGITVACATRHPSELIEAVERQAADVAIIDLKISGDIAVGVGTIRDIKRISPDVRCIVLTAFPALANFLNAHDAGAEAFIRKDHPENQYPTLIDLIRTVVAGGHYYDPKLVEEMGKFVQQIQGVSAPNENPFTERECDVLVLLGQGMSNTEIAEELVIAENTVKTHVRNMQKRIGAGSRYEIVLTALSKGWLPPDPSSDSDS